MERNKLIFQKNIEVPETNNLIICKNKKIQGIINKVHLVIEVYYNALTNIIFSVTFRIQ